MMEAEQHNNEINDKSVAIVNEIYSFKELIDVIVNYYCFKNNIEQIEDERNMEDEGDQWKKYIKNEKEEENNNKDMIPNSINELIEKSFAAQLKKFIEGFDY